MMTIPQTLREAVRYDIDSTDVLSDACGDDWCDGDTYVERGWVGLPDLELDILSAFMEDEEKWLCGFGGLEDLRGDFFILLVAEALETDQ